MPDTKTEIESQIIELSETAFEAFCDDISSMFGIDMECQMLEVSDETTGGLAKRFKKKMGAFNFVKSKGILDGTFQLVFDQGGMFIVSGTIIMLSEKQILEKVKRGEQEDIEQIQDALKEAGNLFVGSWDKVFRENLKGHKHFLQTETYIGKPWEDPKHTINLDEDEIFTFVPFEITIGSYPTFNCGVIFPKALLEMRVESSDEQVETDSEEVNVDELQSAEDIETKTEENDDIDPEQHLEELSQTDIEDEDQSVCEEQSKEPDRGTVSDSISKIVQQSEGFMKQPDLTFMQMHAEDIMSEKIPWCDPEESVQNAMMEMQKMNVSCMLVGTDGKLDGIVSKSDINGAISIYLEPMFSKWRTPHDEATLRIKVKWIMTRPVHVIDTKMPLSDIIEYFIQAGKKCLPVMDEDSQIKGLVTTGDILKVVWNSNQKVTLLGDELQAPSLM